MMHSQLLDHLELQGLMELSGWLKSFLVVALADLLVVRMQETCGYPTSVVGEGGATLHHSLFRIAATVSADLILLS